VNNLQHFLSQIALIFIVNVILSYFIGCSWCIRKGIEKSTTIKLKYYSWCKEAGNVWHY